MKLVKIKRKRRRRRRRKKNVFFDRVTIFLILILTGLIFMIGGILIWKEKNIETTFEFFNVLKSSKESNQINRGDWALISFSGPVRPESFSGNVVIEPALDFSLDWINNHQLKVTLKESPFPGTDYELKLKTFKSKWGLSNRENKQKFSTNPLPEIVSFYPTKGQVEVSDDEKIIFEFTEPLADQYYLKVKSNPDFQFKSKKTEEENEIVIEPLKRLDFDTEYDLEVEVKSRNYSDFSYSIVETQFKTEKPPIVVYGLNAEGKPSRFDYMTEQAQPKILEGRYIDIDLSKQNLYIFENGKELGAYKISSGIRGMNTPAGNFKVLGRSRRPWSNKYGLFMPWFIQFTYEGHGIHELPEWPGGYKEGTNHLGIPVSHGCVRLGIGPAKLVYQFAETGTPIVIHY